MYYTGIDIGSTSSKVSVFEEDKLKYNFIMPTGWSSVDTSKQIEKYLNDRNIYGDNSKTVATGYGRVSVPYADKTVTEITCHAKGVWHLSGENLTLIDIGGQDTKIITLRDGNVLNFTMNDKCAAGTGRFLELMANTLGVTIDELTELAKNGNEINISSMCTVFAESEVISLIGNGAKREDIASGVIGSITGKVKSLCQRHGEDVKYYLTGGLCDNEYIIDRLQNKLNRPVMTNPLARYAGSIGAAIIAMKL